MKNEELKQALREIKVECLSHFRCMDCKFHNNDGYCTLKGTPYDWVIDDTDLAESEGRE